MYYVEYEQDTGLVLEIHRKEPSVIRENCLVVRSDGLQLGMESSYDIIIERILDDGKLVVNCTLKPDINNYHYAERLGKLEGEKQELKERLSSTEKENLDIKLALAELADIIAGGVYQ